ncbi:hypothetical protein F66182_490 [Fusarium sp. NRRL 66182]|nr:hypothetical protein F66182_490 [Fusarium sp. NRRL 66182]
MALPSALTADDSKQQLDLKPSDNAGDPDAVFSVNFPGIQPTLSQRREYMAAIFQWHTGNEDFESRERKLRNKTEAGLVRALVSKGVESFVNTRADKRPKWPWPRPPRPAPGEGNSTTFFRLKQRFRRDGKMFREQDTTPSTTSSRRESLPFVQMVTINGTLFPVAPQMPDLGERKKVWEARYPGQDPGTQPFYLRLPADFGFWPRIWGRNGRDWDKIQRELVDERVKLTWGYEQLPIDEARCWVRHFSSDDLAKVDQFLAVGFAETAERGVGLWFDKDKQVNQRRDYVIELPGMCGGGLGLSRKSEQEDELEGGIENRVLGVWDGSLRKRLLQDGSRLWLLSIV